MVKPKQRQNHGASGKKRQNQNSPKTDPSEDADWMVVKKQKITIIIPPLPNKKHFTMASLGEGQLQENPINTINSHSPRKTNSKIQSPSPKSASNQSVQEPEKCGSSPEKAIQPSPIMLISEPNLNTEKPSSISHRTTSDNPPHLSHCRSREGIKTITHNTSFLNLRMRASYLERKIKKAGGLEKWLVSLELDRFVKVFEMRRVGRFQLANLTMQKLKEMGTEAVGPRRKLMHAIDCLCEPHCFQIV